MKKIKKVYFDQVVEYFHSLYLFKNDTIMHLTGITM